MGASVLFLAAIIAANAPVPVEIWTGGDIGTVQRLSDSVRQAFQNSQKFSLSYGQKTGTIYVTVPVEIKMRPVGGRIAITASIGFAHAPPNAPQELVGTVNCWDDDMSACGQGAVALAAKLP
jgi:hypothetical protein